MDTEEFKESENEVEDPITDEALTEFEKDTGFDDDTIYHVDGLNNCPFRLAQSKQCTLPRQTIGVALGICVPPNPGKNTVPGYCPLLIQDYTVSLIVN